MPDLVALFFQDGRPFEGDGGILVDLEDGFLPGRLVRDLAAHVPEAVIGDDLGGAEILELGRIRPGFFRQADEQLGPLQVAVVVGGDIGDEIGGMVCANAYAMPIWISMLALPICLKL